MAPCASHSSGMPTLPQLARPRPPRVDLPGPGDVRGEKAQLFIADDSSHPWPPGVPTLPTRRQDCCRGSNLGAANPDDVGRHLSPHRWEKGRLAGELNGGHRHSPSLELAQEGLYYAGNLCPRRTCKTDSPCAAVFEAPSQKQVPASDAVPQKHTWNFCGGRMGSRTDANDGMEVKLQPRAFGSDRAGTTSDAVTTSSGDAVTTSSGDAVTTSSSDRATECGSCLILRESSAAGGEELNTTPCVGPTWGRASQPIAPHKVIAGSRVMPRREALPRGGVDESRSHHPGVDEKPPSRQLCPPGLPRSRNSSPWRPSKQAPMAASLLLSAPATQSSISTSATRSLSSTSAAAPSPPSSSAAAPPLATSFSTVVHNSIGAKPYDPSDWADQSGVSGAYDTVSVTLLPADGRGARGKPTEMRESVFEVCSSLKGEAWRNGEGRDAAGNNVPNRPQVAPNGNAVAPSGINAGGRSVAPVLGELLLGSSCSSNTPMIRTRCSSDACHGTAAPCSSVKGRCPAMAESPSQLVNCALTHMQQIQVEFASTKGRRPAMVEMPSHFASVKARCPPHPAGGPSLQGQCRAAPAGPAPPLSALQLDLLASASGSLGPSPRAASWSSPQGCQVPKSAQAGPPQGRRENEALVCQDQQLAVFHARRAAIRKGVRDQQQAHRQHMHRRGASAAQESFDGLGLETAGLNPTTAYGAGDSGLDSGVRSLISQAFSRVPPMGNQAPHSGLRTCNPLSALRHTLGKEPGFFNPSRDCPETEHPGANYPDLAAEYRVVHSKDLAKILQGPFGAPPAEEKRRPPGPRQRGPSHSMDFSKSAFLVDHGKGQHEKPPGVARKGSTRGIMASSSFPPPVFKRLSLSPQDYILGRPYEDVSKMYAMHRSDLGAGQFGVVRKCKDVATGAVYACKTIRKECIRCAEDADDIRKEVACMRLLDKHPRFVNLHNAFEDRHHVHLVMDVCTGGDLLEHIRMHGPLSEARAAKMCQSLLEALLHCHCLGIVHRDVKPENILLTSSRSDADMKLVDFGVSTFFKPGEVLTEIIGTPEYMSPEMLAQTYGPEVDVWSAGVVLYIALTGVPPFWASDRQGLTDSIKNKVVKFKASRWAGISEDCRDVVSKMLDKDPARRISETEILRHPWILKYCGT